MSWQGGAPPYYQGYADEDDTTRREQIKIAFSDKKIRTQFIRKVYAILMIQLICTFGGLLFISLHEPTRIWFSEPRLWLYIVVLIVILVVLITLGCCANVRRKTPLNYILLAIFTAAFTVSVGFTVVYYSLDIIVMALGITTVVFTALTVFALTTTIDFTKCFAFLFAALILLCIVTFVFFFFPSKTLQTVICSLGVLIFSVYVVFDTQLMLGGNHKYAISPEDYILAVLNLYIDFVMLFLYILQLLESD